MIVSRSYDKQTISKILNHPKVKNWVNDDYSPEKYEPVINENSIYLVDENHHGVIMLDPMNNITCSVHIATLPDMWGSCIEFAKEAIRWGFNSENTRCLKVVAIIPEYNRLAVNLVKKLKFGEEGILKKSFLKKWTIYDQIIFGLAKGDLACQQ